MRCDIVTGFLLILSVIDFTLAAPVLVQEKHQARTDGVNILKDGTTVLGKRWDEDTVRKLLDKYHELKMELGTTSSSSSASSVADHESTNVVLPPAPNHALSSTDDWNPPTKLFRSSSLPELGSAKDMPPSSSNPTMLTYVWDPTQHAFVPAPSVPYHESTNTVLPPAPDPSRDMWTAAMSDSGSGSGSGSETESQASKGPEDAWWERFKPPDDYKVPDEGVDELPVAQPYSPTSSSSPSAYNSDYELAEAEEHMYVPPPSHYSWSSSTDSSPDLNFDHEYWMGSEDPTTNELGQAHEDQVDNQSLSADPQAEDPEAAARYAAKGKAKESRHISGTARNVGDAA